MTIWKCSRFRSATPTRFARACFSLWDARPREARGRGTKLRLLYYMGIACVLLRFNPPPACAADKPKAGTRAAAVRKVADRVDERIAARYSAAGIEPSPRSDDAEFFRRVSLHLSGSIPPVSDVRTFLADGAADKRETAIDRLLARPSYVRHFATIWRRAWLPDADIDPQVQTFAPSLEAWLRQQLVDDRRYDELVRELLSVPVAKTAAASQLAMNDGLSGPLSFLLAREAKPENLAAGVSRSFLGVRLDCAQCHDHPYDLWKREQFWSFAAFFAGLERGGGNQLTLAGGLYEVSDRRELMIPETNRLAAAVFLDGSEPKWRTQSGRQLLANWITARDNPYFAKAAVNRLWGHLFGIGLVDPVDDFSTANAPSHPELLDELTAAFIERNFDVKFLLKSLLMSDTYQRTSRQFSEDLPPALYASFAVQGLSAEELVRSLTLILGADQSPEELALRFSRASESPTQRQMMILQALTMMNGFATARAIDADQGALLAAVIDFPGQTPAECVETLFVATLSRLPSGMESQRCVQSVETANDSRRGLGDVLWALLNSAEFGCNH